MGSDSAPSPRASESGYNPNARRVVRMGKYEVVQHIATGGMGAVYRGRDTESNREVALKILPPETAAKTAMLVRFQREARSAIKLHHENIVTTYEIGEIGGTWFLAMEFIDGIDLHDYVKRKGPLDPEEARQLILQGARAVRHAGEQSIVHRDIKPSNFLLMRKKNRSVIKLTDFGLAREIDADEFRVTQAGTTVGTIDYMSPEQARDSSAADIRSDLYSLGSTWYHLLAGHPPFPDGGLGERLIKIMNDEPPDIREEVPRVSNETWAILSRLLEKDPDDRYQTPSELIDELLALEGKAATKPETKVKTSKKKSKKSRSDTDTDAKTNTLPRAVKSGAKPVSRMRLWYAVAGLALLLMGVVVVAVSLPKKQIENKPTVERPATPDGSNSSIIDKKPEEKDKKPEEKGKKPEEKGKKPEEKGKKPPIETPIPPRWPALYKGARAVNVKSLREEVDAPWATFAPAPADAFRARVSRVAGRAVPGLRTAGAEQGTYRSLAEACSAAPAGRAIIIEIHDNGPLFELPMAVSGRDLTIRAGKGYRPLILWDLTATVSERKRLKKIDQPITFVQIDKGRLVLEGLEVAWRWPETLADPGALVDVQSGNLDITDCTFSAAGKPPEGVTLVRFRAGPDKARCRFTRCHARGAGLVALDLDGAADVLFDGCLVVGGQQPLLRVRSATKKGPELHVVRSTLVSGRTLLELKPAAASDRSPGLSWLSWDSLLSRSSPSEGGEMFTLLDGADTNGMEWRSVNSLYAGWKSLLAGGKIISSDALGEWHRLWKRVDGDGVARDPWPDQSFTEPATQPATTYQPIKAVGYASTVDPEQLLGCDLARLPETRDGWLGLALEPVVSAPEAPPESAPEIPNPGDGKYHGERLEIKDIDLGMYLARRQERMKFGPRVVLHLFGKGEHLTSPISLKGSSLVLFFEEPTDKEAAPLVLKLGSPSSPVPLIEVVDGNVEMIGGVLRAMDSVTAKISHLIRVKGGEIKLHRTRLEGPQQSVPDGYRAAVALVGSGDPAADKMHGCALNECVVLSSRGCVLLDGVGCQLLVRQSVLVSGMEALHLMPGASCKGRAAMHCTLEHVTFACRTAVVRLGDAESAGVPTESVIVQARDCAYLNPFPGKPSKSGLVIVEGDSLSRGLLLWQGENECFDQRLFFSIAKRGFLPDKKEGYSPWKQLWGSQGMRTPRPELSTRLLELDARRWALERLILPIKEPPGANMKALGIGVRKGTGPR